jgi:hypothetical protein
LDPNSGRQKQSIFKKNFLFVIFDVFSKATKIMENFSQIMINSIIEKLLT